MSNLSMVLCGKLAKSAEAGWSTFLRWIATYPVDKVMRSLNNWGQVLRLVLVYVLSTL